MTKIDITGRLNLLYDFAEKNIKRTSIIHMLAIKIDIPDSPLTMGAVNYA